MCSRHPGAALSKRAFRVEFHQHVASQVHRAEVNREVHARDFGKAPNNLERQVLQIVGVEVDERQGPPGDDPLTSSTTTSAAPGNAVAGAPNAWSFGAGVRAFGVQASNEEGRASRHRQRYWSCPACGAWESLPQADMCGMTYIKYRYKIVPRVCTIKSDLNYRATLGSHRSSPV